MARTPQVMIVDVEATPVRYSAEAQAARVMVARTRERLGLAVTALGADRGYGNGPFLAWCRDHGVTAYAPVLDRRHQGNAPYGHFTVDEFVHDRARDEYVCPAGARLRHVASTPTTQVHQYRAAASVCGACALKPRCTRGRARQLRMALAGTPAYVAAAHARKKVEERLAELKRWVNLRRLRLRGLPRAAEQFLLAAAAQNLKRLAAARP